MINIKLANIPIQLDNRYPDLEDFCRDYVTQEPPQMVLSVTAHTVSR